VTEPSEQFSDRISARGIASIERAFLRLTFWQTLLSLAGVFTGGVALYAALGESEAVRQQTAATVWPYVQVIINDHISGDDAHLSLEVNNVGVGPARLRSIQLKVDDRVYKNWEEILTQLMGAEAENIQYGRSSLQGRVLAPAETLMFFSTDNRQVVLAMQSKIYSGAVDLSYCYCSIFDECWLMRNQRDADPEPVRVEQCPDYGVSAFEASPR
jgi:hypothetical protein